jgi:hypothetical protein
VRIYISGAIGTDVPGTTPESRREAFYTMQNRLELAGHEAVNPLDVPACSPIPDGACGVPVDPTDEQSHSWLCYMKYDIRAMMECDAVLGLHNSHVSKGALVEINLAQALGMPVFVEYENGVVNQTLGEVTVASLLGGA